MKKNKTLKAKEELENKNKNLIRYVQENVLLIKSNWCL